MTANITTGFRVDALLHSLKELQNEKNCLEQKLNEQRQRRRELEKSLESVNMKYMQVTDINSKMVETLKVAEHKENQSQSMANSLEQANIGQRGHIGTLNNKINTEKGKQLEEIQRFEERLSQITDELKSCRQYYSDLHLEEEISGVQDRKMILEEKFDDFNMEVEGLTRNMEDLLMRCNEIELNDEGISLDIRQEVWDAFSEENKAYHHYLENLGSIIDKLKKDLINEDEDL